MKLVTFSHNGSTRIGALVSKGGQEQVIDFQKVDASLPTDMIAFLEGGTATLAAAQKAVDGASDGLPVSSVKILAPIPRPGKIICIGLNYSDHAAETGQPIPKYPIVFSKYANTVVATGDKIVLPHVTNEVDYEAELGFVIGKTARYVSADQALDYVAGYLPINDVSARDYQTRISQWTMGKTFDTFAPMGPAIVTSDEVGDAGKLTISLTINGEVLQDSNTDKLIFGIPQLVEALSEVMTLEPGDIVSTGTPPGVGMARNPKRYMKPGDVVDVTIEKLGTLSNPVVGE
ncbi:MAG: fumarylacetoacetate hydrolase family protein [Chloroflexi bacterium]|nr:fumarylacetoacetate hydrolase family protein [Chloroflexota bacterium]MCC6893874.1 fumarylacetoacetate hydrolase family protein [Anaerolineae bacterium]